MEQWTSTLDTREAAAIGTLGIPTRIETTIVERTGQRISRIFMAVCCIERKFLTGNILNSFRGGKLQRSEPLHPFITIQRAFENRLHILDLQNKGIPCSLVRVPATELWQYVPGGSGLPGISGAGEVIKTTDLKLVSALALVGLAILLIEGSPGRHIYYLPRYGPARAGGLPPVDAVDFMRAWRNDRESIPWEEPFAQAMRGLYNRERYLDAIRKDVELILIQKPRSPRAALIRVDASEKAFDSMKEHFDR